MNALIDALRACIAQAEIAFTEHNPKGTDARLQAIRDIAQEAIDAHTRVEASVTPAAPLCEAAPDVLTLQAEVLSNLAKSARMNAQALNAAPGSVRARQAACLDWLALTLGYQLYLQGKSDTGDAAKLAEAELEVARQFPQGPGAAQAGGPTDTQLLAWLAQTLEWDGSAYWLPDLKIRSLAPGESVCPELGLEGLREALAEQYLEKQKI